MILLIGSALAWDSIGATWPAEAFPIEVRLSADVGVLDDAETLAALESAAAEWSSAECAPLVQIEVGEPVEGGTFGVLDGVNQVFVIEEGWPEEASLLSTPSLGTAGTEIVEADIALNAQYYAFTTNGSGWDLQATITHELGHALGLWHSAVADASLNPALNGNTEARTLAQDDLDGLCALYAGASPGEGQQGESCVENADCAQDLLCLADGADSYCTATCSADDDCPSGAACVDVVGQGVCVEGEGEGCGGCASPGAPGALALLLALALTRRR